MEQQYGFRSKLSTNHAVTDITNKYKKPVTMVSMLVEFMYTLKGLNHNLLPDKLAHYRVRGVEITGLKPI